MALQTDDKCTCLRLSSESFRHSSSGLCKPTENALAFSTPIHFNAIETGFQIFLLNKLRAPQHPSLFKQNKPWCWEIVRQMSAPPMTIQLRPKAFLCHLSSDSQTHVVTAELLWLFVLFSQVPPILPERPAARTRALLVLVILESLRENNKCFVQQGLVVNDVCCAVSKVLQL